MKIVILLIFLILESSSGFSQNILEALQLKDHFIGAYAVGELMPTDTIVDLRNGYYEEFASAEAGAKTIIRQAAIFHNYDGSSTLGISITGYDFVCFSSETNFYGLLKTKDSIRAIENTVILPDLNIMDFIKDTVVLSVLNRYLPEIQKNYLDTNAGMEDLLSEVYQIRYLLPQRGTELKATLTVCDYIPSNIVSIRSDEWSIIENGFMSIQLEYDKVQQRFKKIGTEKTEDRD